MPNTFICMKWTWYVYEVYRRSQSQPNSVVSSQMWKKQKKTVFDLFGHYPIIFFLFYLMLNTYQVIVYNFHTKYLNFCLKKKKSRKTSKNYRKNTLLIFLTLMPRFIFISILVGIIEEAIVYNFHKKYLDFCKKYLSNSPVQPLATKLWLE